MSFKPGNAVSRTERRRRSPAASCQIPVDIPARFWGNKSNGEITSVGHTRAVMSATGRSIAAMKPFGRGRHLTFDTSQGVRHYSGFAAPCRSIAGDDVYGGPSGRTETTSPSAFEGTEAGVGRRRDAGRLCRYRAAPQRARGKDRATAGPTPRERDRSTTKSLKAHHFLGLFGIN